MRFQVFSERCLDMDILPKKSINQISFKKVIPLSRELLDKGENEMEIKEELHKVNL